MNTISSKLSTNTYTVCQDNSYTICADITEQLLIWNIKIDLVLNKETNKYTDIPATLPTYFLTLKVHKIPQSVRGVASVSGTPIAALARPLSKAQQLCIQTIDEIWRKLALLCKVACNGSWVITDISDVPARFKHAYKYAENWLQEMEVYDFTSMYDKFVHTSVRLPLIRLFGQRHYKLKLQYSTW
jgi:hypothetical protein